MPAREPKMILIDPGLHRDDKVKTILDFVDDVTEFKARPGLSRPL